MLNNLHKNVRINQNIPDDILPVYLYRVFIEYAVTQLRHQQFTTVSSHHLLFRPSSERDLFKIKKLLYNLHSAKLGRDLVSLTKLRLL